MRGLGLIGVCVVLAGCGPQAFACSSDEACQSDGMAGKCEPIGFCSFPDDACPSGRRYGDLAGGGLAGQCAPGGEAETDGGGSTSTEPTGSGVTTDPTVGSTAGPTTSMTTTGPSTTTDGTSGDGTSGEGTSGDGTSGGGSSSEGDSSGGPPEPTCEDDAQNGDETDEDCGGPICPGCDVRQMCGGDSDCASGLCDAGVCAGPDVPDICDDGMQNGAEVGVDCGGTCAPCGTPCEGMHARWNSDDAQQNIEFEEDFRVATVTVDSSNDSVRADTPLQLGTRYYWEVEVVAAATNWIRIGTADATMFLEVGPNGADGFGISPFGSVQGVGMSGLTVAAGDIVGVAVDVSEHRAWLHVNGTYGFMGGPTQSDGFAFEFSEVAQLYPSVTLGQGDTLRANFGNAPLIYSIPPGFVGGVCN